MTARQSGQHLGMLVGGIVVEDDVDRQAGYDLAPDDFGKGDELAMAMALHAAADDRAVKRTKRGEQG